MTKNIYTIFNVLIITAIIFMGVDTFYRILEARLEQPDLEQSSVIPKPVQSKRSRIQRLSDYDIINRRSLFGKAVDALQKSEGNISEIENLEPTSLDLVLLGTVAGNHENAYAIITDKSKRSQDIYRIGDSVKNAVIQNIYRGKVVLRVNGKDEVLSMDEAQTQTTDSTPPPVSSRTPVTQTRSVPERTITLQRSEVEESLSNIQELATQASIKPHFTDGEEAIIR